MEEKAHVFGLVKKYPDGVTSSKLLRLSGLDQKYLSELLAELVKEDRVSTQGTKRNGQGIQVAVWITK